MRPEREAELRALGLPDDAIQVYLQKESPQDNDDIEVLEENWDAVRVYQLCTWDMQPFFNFSMSMGGGSGSSGLRYVGIRNSEIESVCRALEVSYDEELLMKVRVLANAASPILNEE